MSRFTGWCIYGAALVLLLSLFGCEPVENPTTTSDTEAAAEVYAVKITSPYFAASGNEYNWFQGEASSREAYAWSLSSNGVPFNAGRWQAPFTKAGVYTVRVYLPAETAMAPNVRYDIIANSQTKNVSINQTTNPNRWVSLGSFTFSGQGYEYVELTNVTGASNSRVVFSTVEFARETIDVTPTPTPTATPTPN